MKQIILSITIAIASLFLSGCDQTTSTLTCAAIGTAAGIGIDYEIDSSAEGTAIGGVVDALKGAAIGLLTGDKE